MVRRFVWRLLRATILLTGIVAWASLSLRGAATWVCLEAKGMWFQQMGDLPWREVAIVPGSGFHRGRANPGMEERLYLGLALYKSGRIRKLLVSGNDEPNGHEVSEMRRWFIERGVRSEDVLTDPFGVRTRETMTRAARVFGVRQAIVCTQSWAAPRALFLAQAAGIDAVAFVPQMDRHRNDLLAPENLKIALAFAERYLLVPSADALGRSAVEPPSLSLEGARSRIDL